MIPYHPDRVPRAAGPSRHDRARVLGLTGGIGGGKSEVARIFKEHGAVVIDADAVGHDVLNDPAARAKIVERFGAGVLATAPGEPGSESIIDRRALGAIVFADPRARHELESIVHPRMRERFVETIEREERIGGAGRLVVLDAAILLEAGWDDLCDVIAFVDAPRDERLARVERQRGWSRASFEAREQAQWSCAQKRCHADLVINNDFVMESLRREVERVLDHLAEFSCSMVEAPDP